MVFFSLTLLFLNILVNLSSSKGVHVGHLVQARTADGRAQIYWRHDGCSVYPHKRDEDNCSKLRKQYKGQGAGGMSLEFAQIIIVCRNMYRMSQMALIFLIKDLKKTQKNSMPFEYCIV
jgi:hypothetical protein